MKTKQQILKRINLLYYIFFAVILTSVVVGVSGRDFRAGFKAGYNSALHGDSLSKVGYEHVQHYTFVQNDISAKTGYDLPLKVAADSSYAVKGRVNLIDLEVQSRDKALFASDNKTVTLAVVLLFVAAATYIAVFVVLFKILISLRRSAREGNLFAKRNIFRIRLIALLLIAASVVSDLAVYLRDTVALKYLEGTQFTGYVGFPITFREILLGMLILFVAEIFAVGYDLTEEEKFTI